MLHDINQELDAIVMPFQASSAPIAKNVSGLSLKQKLEVCIDQYFPIFTRTFEYLVLVAVYCEGCTGIIGILSRF